MKKLYAKPEIEISAFDTEDIMTTSGGGMGTESLADLTGNNSGEGIIDFGGSN